MSVRLQAQFHHVGHPAVHEGSSQKADREHNSNKAFQLQSEYKDHRRIRVTVCSVPIELNGDIAAYLSNYGGVEGVLPARLSAGTAHSDYMINMCSVGLASS